MLVLLLSFSCAGFLILKVTLDKLPRKKIPGASVIYVPSGKYLKYATFGFSSLAADLIYLWAIQYYSTYTVVDRLKYLEHIFSVIAELDPRYTDPYEVGALIAAYEAKDLALAYKILDLGLEKNPDQWIFPFLAGHYAQMLAKDFATARRYYAKTMAIEGAPDFTQRLYANAAFKMMDLQTSWETWQEVYKTAPDDRVKKIASNHLYQVKSAIDKKTLEEALAEFKQRYGHYPSELSDLVRARFLSSLPKDLDGQDYLYNPQKGEVKASKIWWKR